MHDSRVADPDCDPARWEETKTLGSVFAQPQLEILKVRLTVKQIDPASFLIYYSQRGNDYPGGGDWYKDESVAIECIDKQGNRQTIMKKEVVIYTLASYQLSNPNSWIPTDDKWESFVELEYSK